MTRLGGYFVLFLRQNPARPRVISNTQIRNLVLETKEGDFNKEKSQLNVGMIREGDYSCQGQNLEEIADEICRITRTKPRWEQTLLSDYPFVKFSDPQFFRVFLKRRNNVLISLRFYHWLCSHCGFSLDQSSFNLLFDALVESKACKAAKSVLDSTGLDPEPASLEGYIQCLCEDGLVEEALNVFAKLKNIGLCPSIATWNSALSGCLKIGRTDLLWTLYMEMIESGVVANANVETVRYLTQAFCIEGKTQEGYRLLRQILEAGFTPDNDVFNTLISGFCRERKYGSISEALHIMIAKGRNPDIFTYQGIISGLFRNRKGLEGFRVFNDLKDRGYFPDRVMYTTVIHGLCEMEWLGEARKLWFEMIRKGFCPNEFTYNSLIHGYCKIGNLDSARHLYQEMQDRGYKETTISCNTMISGLCLLGRIDEACDWFRQMSQKGIPRDLITYNTLIQGLSEEGKLGEARRLFNELLLQGLQPSTLSYTPLIRKLCEVGDIQKAHSLWKDMHDRGLQPMVRTHDDIICGLCVQGSVEEGMEWLVQMLNSKLKPQKGTFERMIQCLLQSDRIHESLLALDLMFRVGYTLKESICHSLVDKLCKENFCFVETCLGEILV